MVVLQLILWDTAKDGGTEDGGTEKSGNGGLIVDLLIGFQYQNYQKNKI